MIHVLTTIIGAALLMLLIGVLIGAAVCFFEEDRQSRDDERARVRAQANESLARHLTRPYGCDLDVEPREKRA